MILALDPGPTQTAYALWDGVRLHECGIEANEHILGMIKGRAFAVDTMAIEDMECFGMPVGREVLQTCKWIGKFELVHVGTVREVYRKQVKVHLCNSMRAKDPNIRQALIDRFGPPGTKKNPGPLYGARSHVWAALAVAVYAHDTAELLAADRSA